MNAQCAHCATQITIDDSKLGAHGAKVRCPCCDTTVIIERPGADIELDVDAKGDISREDTRTTDPDAPAYGDRTIVSPPPTDPHANAAYTTSSVQPIELELVNDDDLLLLDAEPDGSEAETKVMPLSQVQKAPAKPADDAWHTKTRVAIVPRLKLNAEPRPQPAPEPPSPLDPTAAADDSPDPSLAGGLTAEGLFIAPSLAPAAPSIAAAPSPAPTRMAVPPVSMEHGLGGNTESRASTVSMAAPRTRSVVGSVLSALGVLALLAVLGVGVLVFVQGGQVDAKVFELNRGLLARAAKPHVRDGVEVVSARSVLYPTRSGANILVVYGTVRNTGKAPRERLQATVVLSDAKGVITAKETVPVGVLLSPEELSVADDADTLAALYRARLEADRGRWTLAPGATANYNAVIRRPPPQLASSQHSVTFTYAALVAAPQPFPPYLLPQVMPSGVFQPVAPAKAKGKGKFRFRGKAKASMSRERG